MCIFNSHRCKMASPRSTYDKEFWDSYASVNEARYDAEFAGRVAYTANELCCKSVLEVGCGTGIDLRLLPDNVRICGLDPNHSAITTAKINIPQAHLTKGMITNMPFVDSSIDMIFTHRLLNYLLDENTIMRGMQEMHRVAKKYIMSCEWFAQNEVMLDSNRKLRNMQQRWTDMGATVMADVSIHQAETDLNDNTNKETRLTLVRK